MLLIPSNVFAYTTQKVYALDPADFDKFGESVAISGNRAIVGAPDKEINTIGTGAAYIFEKTNSTWSQAARLTPSDAFYFDEFGKTVAICGDLAIVGAPEHYYEDFTIDGAAYIFEYTNSTWSQAAKLTPVYENDIGDNFGYSVDISENFAVVGSDLDSALFIFERTENSWSLVYTRTTEDNESFVSISGNDIIFSNQSETYFFEYVNDIWTEIEHLSLEYTTDNDMSENYALISDSPTYEFEPALIYEKNASSWNLSVTLTADDFTQVTDTRYFAYYAAITDKYALITSESTSLSEVNTSIFLYKRNGNNWIPSYEFLYPYGYDYEDVNSIAMSEENAIVGSSWDFLNGDYPGSVYFIQLYDLSISSIDDQAIMLGSQAMSNNFTIASDSSVLQLTIESSNPSFLTAGAISFNYSNTSQSRSLTLTNFSDSIMMSLTYNLNDHTRSNSTLITVTVMHENGETRSESFGLTVFQLLYVDPIPDDIYTIYTLSENYSINVQSYFQGVTLTVGSSNTDFISQDGITFNVNGLSQTSPYTMLFDDFDNLAIIGLSITPVTDQLGSSTITITAENFFGHTHTQSFNISKINNLPTITGIINDDTIVINSISSHFSFSVADADAEIITLTCSTSDSFMLSPNQDIVMGGAANGSNGTYTVSSLSTPQLITMSLTPADQTGIVMLTITVSDGKNTASSIFTLTIVNHTPEISGLPENISTTEDLAIGPISFTVTDADNPETLTVTIVSSNTNLISAQNIALSGTNNSYALSLTPTDQMFGARRF